MRKPLRSVAKSPRKSSPTRRLVLKTAAPELSAEEVEHLDQISQRYEDSERAWQRMTAPLDGDEPWTNVEEHLLSRSPGDQDRRWKFFSK